MAMELPMARRSIRCISLSLTVAAATTTVQAREPAFECVDAGALRVTCTGGLADGKPATGLTVRVFDKNGELRVTGRIDVYGRFTFRKPGDDYHVVIDTGGGDVITILGHETT